MVRQSDHSKYTFIFVPIMISLFKLKRKNASVTTELSFLFSKTKNLTIKLLKQQAEVLR